MNRIMLCSVCVVALLCQTSWADPWADIVVSYNAGDATDYTNSSVVLGEPSRTTAAWPEGTESVRMTASAWQESEVLKIGNGGSLVVGFRTPVENDPLNPFGIDLLIFTNLAYASSDWPANQTIGSPLYSFGGAIGTISVSQDGVLWYQVTSTGPMFPTHAYLSAEADAYATGATPTDYTLPVDPSLSGDDFAGLSLTAALALYNGSGGGLGIDLSALEGGTVGLDWIQYVKIEGATNALDGFADVAAVPEPATMLLLGGGLAAMAMRRRRAR
ncbi:MAG: PEP-CTERM sorting domain-containing protein [Planctomycetes bacterium]|nr:PEP-CTERM sorting domain-containing protein [Planctomycetota bacterium]